MVNILQFQIPPDYLSTNNTIQFDIPHSTQFYNVLASVLATYSPLDGDLYEAVEQSVDVSDIDNSFQADDDQQFDVFTFQCKVNKHFMSPWR